jgi:sarcosine oxidase subunit beta
VGTATAFWLSRAGLDVVVVEMRDGLSTLTTPASAECFRAQFAEPAMAALAIPSIEMFEHFDEVIGLPGYNISIKQQGYLFLTDDPETVDDLKENVEQQHQLGITDSELLERDKIMARFPYISPSVLAATFRQRDGWLSCHETTQGFAKGCEARFSGSPSEPYRSKCGRSIRRRNWENGKPGFAAGAGSSAKGIHQNLC